MSTAKIGISNEVEDKRKHVDFISAKAEYDHHSSIQNVWSDFTVTQSFLNKTENIVIVNYRSGISVPIYPEKTVHESEKSFIIKSHYCFNNNHRIIDTIKFLSKQKEINKTLSEDANILYQVLSDYYDGNRNISFANVCISRNIPQRMLSNNKRSYINVCDLLLEYGPHNPSVYHPYCNEAIAIEAYSKIINDYSPTGVFIDIIDNEDMVGTRYTYMNNEVVKVNARKDSNKESGVYITRVTKHDDFPQVVEKYHSFNSNLEELGLFKNQEEAMTGGNPELLLNKENFESKKELERLKNEHRKKELDYQKETNEIKLEMQRKDADHKSDLMKMDQDHASFKKKTSEEIIELEHRLEKEKKESIKLKEELDAKSSHRKDYYEERSYNRKDSSEVLKYIPLLAMGVAGIFVAFNKK